MISKPCYWLHSTYTTLQTSKYFCSAAALGKDRPFTNYTTISTFTCQLQRKEADMQSAEMMALFSNKGIEHYRLKLVLQHAVWNSFSSLVLGGIKWLSDWSSQRCYFNLFRSWRLMSISYVVSTCRKSTAISQSSRATYSHLFKITFSC